MMHYVKVATYMLIIAQEKSSVRLRPIETLP